MLKPIGDVFIRLLTMIAVPLVLSSLIVGAASLSDLKHIAKIGGKTIGFYANDDDRSKLVHISE